MAAKNNVIKNFHQNIRGLRTKCNELLCHLHEQLPHLLCLTEHHLGNDEITLLNLDNYVLGAHYSRKHLMKDGTCIYLHNILKISTINLDSYCSDKDIEACAVSFISNSCRIRIASVYRSPSGNYGTFLDKMELIIHKLCKLMRKLLSVVIFMLIIWWMALGKDNWRTCSAPLI
jgi:hypothetical protein